MVILLRLSSLPQEPIRPLEKRALNFLVNEYLLKNEYKLSSITFSDENDDQVKISLCCRMFFVRENNKCLNGVNLLSFLSFTFARLLDLNPVIPQAK